MNAYFKLVRFDKPVGIYLLLWPMLWALFLAADGWPEPRLLIIFILGVILMRSAGCVINDYADRRIDKLVNRTAQRPITSGEISASKALKLFFSLIIIAFMLVFLTNALTIGLAFIAAFLATLYPFTKRWTNLPQLVLGAAFAMSVPMAFAATHNFVPDSAWWIFAATLVWTVIYDTMYAMADREEDLKIGVKSTAILFNKYDKLIIGLLQILLIFILIKISEIFNLNVFYDISLAVSAFLMIYHQLLIKNREKTACFKAFLHNNYIGMAIFIGIALSVI
ncbi:4-hydroxybenzoate octaprenyltransferase [Candidatus Thioglobus sp.]|uniref:4-hydroxybenzoate octaprenyltransferase n=1 Tax=Candidatus Thioglobus sp. TaxID=2026721 RepID=UPI003D103F6B